MEIQFTPVEKMNKVRSPSPLKNPPYCNSKPLWGPFWWWKCCCHYWESDNQSKESV